MSNNEQDVIASVMESQNDGQLDTGVGQDEGTTAEESSQEKTEQESSRYHQSRADKLEAELRQERDNKSQYEKIGKYLESHPDVAQTIEDIK